MKMVALYDKSKSDKAQEVVYSLLGSVVFVDMLGAGFDGCAEPDDGKNFILSIGRQKQYDINLDIESVESAVKTIAKAAKLNAPKGLGDIVEKAIAWMTGIEPCGGCNRRKSWLNRVFPFPEK